MEEVERLTALQISEDGRRDIEGPIVREFPLTISLNNQELVTLLCSPSHLKYLAIGYLFSEGLLKDKDEIRTVVVDEQRGIAWVKTKEGKQVDTELLSKRFITSGCGKGAFLYRAGDLQTETSVESNVSVSPDEIFELVDMFQHQSEVYRATHGVHSAALCDNKDIIIFRDDVGRHNAIDKVFGECLLNDIPTQDRMMIISGRVSSEMLLKVAKRGVPVLVSVSVPTNLGVRLANELGVTLVGSVRRKRMNVYSGGWRITGQ